MWYVKQIAEVQEEEAVHAEQDEADAEALLDSL